MQGNEPQSSQATTRAENREARESGAPVQSQHPVIARQTASYRTLVRQVRDYAIFAMDIEGRALTWNEGVEAVLGYREEEFLDTPLSAIFLPEDVASGAPARELETALQKGVADNDRWQRRKNGAAFFASGRTTRLEDENNQCIGFTKVLRDDTVRALTEQRLRESEHRYKAFLEHSSEGIWRYELDTPLDPSLPEDAQIEFIYRNARLAEANDAMATMYGYSRAEELMNVPLAQFLPPDDAEARAYMQRLVQSRYHVQNLESVERDRHGRIRYFENSMVPIFENGKLVRVWGMQRDITERRNIQTALHESEQRRLIAIEAAGVGDWRLDLASELLECSPRALQMHRTDGGRTLSLEEHDRLIHPMDRPVVQGARAAALDPEGAGSYRAEFRFLFADGEVRWLESVGQAFFELRDEQRVPTHIVGAMIDITERKLAEEKLREADRRKDEFLATLAHELRNPLAPLKNGVQIARVLSKADSPLDRTFQMMDRQVDHLVHLVNDLLDVARISSGKIVLRRRPVRIGEVLTQSVEASRALIDARAHQLTIEKNKEDLCVEGDLDRLTQVFSNLLSNAAKYSHAGGHIRIGLDRVRDQVVVTVQDTGIGIPAEDLPDVFELFSQVRAHRGREEGGLGIGLSLVRSLVSLHGGTIEAESAGLGRGSTFTVRLPACSESLLASSDSPQQSPEKSTARRRVLIADDNEDAAASLAMLLELEGHEVATARDGVEALEKAREFQPHVVLLDLGMPRLGGLETATRLRASHSGRPLLIVALTGRGQAGDRERTRQAGFDEHLVKPVDIETLHNLLSGAAD
jgi:PAS domain S-box-containing protein